MAGREVNTTATLRAALFDAIEHVKTRKMSHQEGAAIAGLAGQIVKTADLELKYAATLHKIQQDGGDTTVKSLQLTNDSPESELLPEE